MSTILIDPINLLTECVNFENEYLFLIQFND